MDPLLPSPDNMGLLLFPWAFGPSDGEIGPLAARFKSFPQSLGSVFTRHFSTFLPFAECLSLLLPLSVSFSVSWGYGGVLPPPPPFPLSLLLVPDTVSRSLLVS